MPRAVPTLVFVDDDASFRRIMGRELERMGFVVESFERADGVREFVAANPASVVLLDLHMPGPSGLELLTELRHDDGDLQVIVLTGHGAVAEAVDAMRRGAADFLTKPVSLEVLEQSVRRALATTELLAENRWLRRVALTSKTGEVRLESAAALRLDAQIQRIGPADRSVLVTGESGVGKELVARMLHDTSQRSARPFVAVNCGAIPRPLMESELFGHRRGAFSGAEQKRLGLFEAADGGTLFLDEIGELPLDVQPALLRAIQFGEIRPVGSDTTRKVDTRIIAATHRDLREGVARGEFREDLFYRIAIFELHVPPLRERREDIVPLARSFLRREAARSDLPLHLDASAEAWLSEQEWPGNVRELENAIVRVSVLANTATIDAPTLRELLGSPLRERTSNGLPTLSLRELESLAIEEAMRRHRGNKRGAAEALGVALKTLYNKLNAKDRGDGE